MGDSEAAVAQSSTVTGYASEAQVTAGYPSGGEVGGFASGVSGEFSDVAPAGGEGADPSSGVEGSQVGGGGDGAQQMVVDSVQNDAGYGSVNGNVGGEGGDIVPAVNGSAEQQHAADGSVPLMSAEEERLWNIVRTNTLDFNSWTALIEETEKVAENDISRIRKVYDAFLSEFPLCYGYWKKYADHEVRVGSIDKVVEVYERAVQGVTYSVDMWLHYSLFAVSTYGDPDTIRSMPGNSYSSHLWWKGFMVMQFRKKYFLNCMPSIMRLLII